MSTIVRYNFCRWFWMNRSLTMPFGYLPIAQASWLVFVVELKMEKRKQLPIVVINHHFYHWNSKWQVSSCTLLSAARINYHNLCHLSNPMCKYCRFSHCARQERQSSTPLFYLFVYVSNIWLPVVMRATSIHATLQHMLRWCHFNDGK